MALIDSIRNAFVAAGSDIRELRRRTAKDLPELLASNNTYPVGTVITTRAEGYAYEVVSSGEHLTTAAGVKLKVLPVGGRWSFGALNPAGNGTTNDRPKFVLANAIGGEMFLPKPAVRYHLGSAYSLTNVSVRTDPTATHAALSGNGLLKWARTGWGDEIHRLGGRVFVGSAADRLGGNTGTAAGDTGDLWLRDYDNYAAYLSPNGVLTAVNGPQPYVFVGGARVSDHLAQAGAIVFCGHIVNDVPGSSAWGGIIEIQHEGASGNTGTTMGWEVGAKNCSATDHPKKTPYAGAGGVYGFWMAGGGETPPGKVALFPANTALVVLKNQQSDLPSNRGGWKQGILFVSDALDGSNGLANDAGRSSAIVMARGQRVEWFAPDNALAWSIHSVANTSGGGGHIVLAENFADFTDPSGTPIFRVTRSGFNTGNYLIVNPSAAAGVPGIRAAGDGTDINIAITPKGAGRLQFGTYTATALTPTGFISILDSTGTIRRLLVG